MSVNVFSPSTARHLIYHDESNSLFDTLYCLLTANKFTQFKRTTQDN